MIWINLKKELTKKRTFTKHTQYDWYSWLINHIPEPIEKSAGRINDQIRSLFKAKDYSKPEPVKTGTTIISNMKVVVIEIKTYKKLYHT